uniref:Uncharacterized protein n=1 Tax=Arundo donax TaxID=35708 RepID=A0A0A9EF34_ARUDO
MPGLAHGRMPQLQQLGLTTHMQEHLRSSNPDIDGHGPASSSSGGA